jgi:hypothetical protein
MPCILSSLCTGKGDFTGQGHMLYATILTVKMQTGVWLYTLFSSEFGSGRYFWKPDNMVSMSPGIATHQAW